jgi:CBS domain-containing protein
MASVRASLKEYAPFSRMQDVEVDRLLRGAAIVYFEPGQVVLEPGSAPPSSCYIVRQGAVVGERPRAGGGEYGAVWELSAGEMFPLGALLGQRPATSRYRAERDTFCLAVPAESFQAVFRASPVFSDFCSRRLGHMLDLSREQAQAAYLSDATGALSLASPLSSLVRRSAVRCLRTCTLHDALTTMLEQKVGSMPVVDELDRPVGIFTQQDLIGRVILPQKALSTPLTDVMSSPVQTLPISATAADAVMLMARRGIRHVIVTEDGKLVGVVSERDLFALQRLSSRQVSSTIARARDVDALKHAARDIRNVAKTLVAQGVAAGQLTRLLSSLNDQLTTRLLDLVSRSHDLSGVSVCWLALGSEGRHEQTIATDQDNGIVFETEGDPEAVRPRLLAFARQINEVLDACGYPLCKGGVMASNPQWCGTLDEWRATFARWIDRGDPDSLLAANIFFDFRALWGASALAERLRSEVAERARANPRFLKQMADNALRNRPPLGVFGGFRTASEIDGAPALDLKLNGAAPITDVGRIYALASGVSATNTSERLREAASIRGVPEDEIRALIDAFEFIQLMRLRGQLRERAGDDGNPNVIAVKDIGEIDQRILKEAFRQVRRIQSRLELDYPG